MWVAGTHDIAYLSKDSAEELLGLNLYEEFRTVVTDTLLVLLRTYCSRGCQAALGCLDSGDITDMRRSLPLLAILEDFYCSYEKHRDGIEILTLTPREKHLDLDLVLLMDARVFPIEFDVITTQKASQLGVLRRVPPSLLTAFNMADDQNGGPVSNQDPSS
ncbi:hypothetical protein AZE42_10847 [Rhizopogon vesiculosus]|uniref:Uncharacterized protein n=1 Tax=Rhizopogon vesiculosus TaxID=180088 RepID=A0A1J8PJQ0_9AGAM|nr:hypothetical protein AZE42_10847 [Rhizopogon vesiculosus]